MLTTLVSFLYPDARPIAVHEGLLGFAVNVVLLVTLSLATRPQAPDHAAAIVEASPSGTLRRLRAEPRR